MIDFRYHLVSLASVLIALAVGIVLGAGPLKEDIGNTLTTEVTKLREEKADLRTQLDASVQEAEVREAFETAHVPDYVAGRLTGRSVAVVALPDADDALVDRLSTTLTEAGASPFGVALDGVWTSPAAEDVQRRKDLAMTVLPLLGMGGEVPDERSVDDALAAVLLGMPADAGGAVTEGQSDGEDGSPPTKDAPAPSEDDAARRDAWALLRDEGVVDGGDLPSEPATSVVVVGGPVGDADGAQDRIEAVTALVARLDGGAAGSVVVSAGGTGAAESPDASAMPVVIAIRAQESEDGPSTVDGADTAMGQVSTVEALAEQYAGGRGDYGQGEQATAPFPQDQS